MVLDPRYVDCCRLTQLAAVDLGNLDDLSFLWRNFSKWFWSHDVQLRLFAQRRGPNPGHGCCCWWTWDIPQHERTLRGLLVLHWFHQASGMHLWILLVCLCSQQISWHRKRKLQHHWTVWGLQHICWRRLDIFRLICQRSLIIYDNRCLQIVHLDNLSFECVVHWTIVLHQATTLPFCHRCGLLCPTTNGALVLVGWQQAECCHLQWGMDGIPMLLCFFSWSLWVKKAPVVSFEIPKCPDGTLNVQIGFIDVAPGAWMFWAMWLQA